MGYRGKLHEQDQARRLRAKGWTMPDIAAELGVSRGSVSLWTKDVAFQPRLWKRPAGRRGPNALQRRKADEIECLLADGRERIGRLTDEEFLWPGASTRARAQRRGAGRVRQQRPADDGLLLCVASSLLRYRGEPLARSGVPTRGARSRSSRAPLVRSHGCSDATSSSSRIERRRSDDSTHQARHGLSRRALLRVRGPTERSWAWCRRCYRAIPLFRGSSIGRAADC